MDPSLKPKLELVLICWRYAVGLMIAYIAFHAVRLLVQTALAKRDLRKLKSKHSL